MRWFFILFLLTSIVAGELSRPPVIQPEDLNEFSALPEERKKLIVAALSVAEKNKWLRYKFGGSSPESKGFDCSGAMSFVLKSLNYKVPRTSSDQFLWLKKSKALTNVDPKVKSLQDPIFNTLRPGDLVFWSGTYDPIDGRRTKITHVAMYLGTEKKDGRAVMISSSKGRSYRGEARDGYGVFDFKLPRPTSKAKLVGFGTPPLAR